MQSAARDEEESGRADSPATMQSAERDEEESGRADSPATMQSAERDEEESGHADSPDRGCAGWTVESPGLRDTGRVELGQWLRVDGHADRPLFDQLRGQIIDAIRAGTLAPGVRLPTVRELASELGLAVNTVARAYRELESAGIVETRGRFGTFVARADPADTAMAAAAAAYLDVARGLGLGKADAVRYLEAYSGD